MSNFSSNKLLLVQLSNMLHKELTVSATWWMFAIQVALVVVTVDTRTRCPVTGWNQDQDILFDCDDYSKLSAGYAIYRHREYFEFHRDVSSAKDFYTIEEAKETCREVDPGLNSTMARVRDDYVNEILIAITKNTLNELFANDTEGVGAFIGLRKYNSGTQYEAFKFWIDGSERNTSHLCWHKGYPRYESGNSQLDGECVAYSYKRETNGYQWLNVPCVGKTDGLKIVMMLCERKANTSCAADYVEPVFSTAPVFTLGRTTGDSGQGGTRGGPVSTKDKRDICNIKHPCKNGGVCIRIYNDDAKLFRCQCKFGYVGAACDNAHTIPMVIGFVVSFTLFSALYFVIHLRHNRKKLDIWLERQKRLNKYRVSTHKTGNKRESSARDRSTRRTSRQSLARGSRAASRVSRTRHKSRSRSIK